MNILHWNLPGAVVFLIADAVLAVLFGKPYMMGGLENAPATYRDFITGVSGLTPGTIFGI